MVGKSAFIFSRPWKTDSSQKCVAKACTLRMSMEKEVFYKIMDSKII